MRVLRYQLEILSAVFRSAVYLQGESVMRASNNEIITSCDRDRALLCLHQLGG